VTTAAIEVRDLVKQFDGFTAVDHLSFSVQPGEIFGFLGPNGAGKSTTIKMLCTLLQPTSGTAIVNGYDVVRDPAAVRASIGIIFQDYSLDDRITAEENLRFHCMIYHVPRGERKARIEHVLELVGLADRANEQVRTFSGGMKRRLEIARGLLHRPAVLFLDEPTVGLDPQTRETLWEQIHELRKREAMTVFMTTHYMDEAEHCDRIAIMNEGSIVVLASPEELKASVGKDRVQISTADDAATIVALKERFELEAAVHDGAVMFSVPQGEAFVPRLFAELGVPIQSVSVARPSLDDVFLTYTGTTIHDAEATGTDRLRANPIVASRRR
jgi:ABC-2 type transport system ATP-binding protein